MSSIELEKAIPTSITLADHAIQNGPAFSDNVVSLPSPNWLPDSWRA